jgi:hypothetical protein
MSLTHPKLSLSRRSRPRHYHPLCETTRGDAHFLEELRKKRRLELQGELKKIRSKNNKLWATLMDKNQPRWKYAREIEERKRQYIGHGMVLEGDEYQEFIDPDLLNNGDGSID